MSLALSACKKPPTVSHLPGFNQNSTKLSTVPAGYEMGEAAFSPDGSHVAYVVKKDGKSFIYRDSKMSKAYDEVKNLIYRTESSDLVFIARSADKEFVVSNADEGAKFDSIGPISFAPDGRILYAATKNDKAFIVSGKQASGPIDLPQTIVTGNSDGKRLAYIDFNAAAKKGNVRVCSAELNDCRDGGKYDLVAMLKSDQSHTRMAYIAGKNGKMTLVSFDANRTELSEKEEQWFDEVFLFGLSEGGEHLSFLARRGDKTMLVRDGAETPTPNFDMPLDLVVSKNGRTIVTGVIKDKVIAVVDGKEAGKDYSEINTVSFSADGVSYAFAALIGTNNNIVVNGTTGPSFERVVTPRFAPDGSRVAYRARQSGERFVVVADKDGRTIREHPHYEAVWDLVFSPDGKYVGYGVKRGQELWWIAEKLEGK